MYEFSLKITTTACNGDYDDDDDVVHLPVDYGPAMPASFLS